MYSSSSQPTPTCTAGKMYASVQENKYNYNHPVLCACVSFTVLHIMCSWFVIRQGPRNVRTKRLCTIFFLTAFSILTTEICYWIMQHFKCLAECERHSITEYASIFAVFESWLSGLLEGTRYLKLKTPPQMACAVKCRVPAPWGCANRIMFRESE